MKKRGQKAVVIRALAPLALLAVTLIIAAPAYAQATFPGVVEAYQPLKPPDVNPQVKVYTPPPIAAPAAPVVGFPALVPPPARADTFGERATNCMHHGASQGVAPADLGAYTRACAN